LKLAVVMTVPRLLAMLLLAVLRRLYPMNARPVQPAGGRIVK
jgi:hypothetical protein